VLTLVGMIVFIMDVGRMMMMEQFITERARVTVRQAAVNNWTATQVQNYLVYNSITAPDKGGAGLSWTDDVAGNLCNAGSRGDSGLPASGDGLRSQNLCLDAIYCRAIYAAYNRGDGAGSIARGVQLNRRDEPVIPFS